MHRILRIRKPPKAKNAEALLFTLFKEAMAKDPDAIDAMRTLLNLLPPGRNDDTFFLLDGSD